jgi:hypothetical protein
MKSHIANKNLLTPAGHREDAGVARRTIRSYFARVCTLSMTACLLASCGHASAESPMPAATDRSADSQEVVAADLLVGGTLERSDDVAECQLTISSEDVALVRDAADLAPVRAQSFASRMKRSVCTDADALAMH